MDMNQFDRTVKQYTTWLDNPYVSGALIVFLIVYAGMAAPRLPSYIANLFDYTAVKLLIFFLIAYLSKKNATVALIAAIALMISIMTLNKLKFGEEMMEVVHGEKKPRRFRTGGCECSCDDMEELIDAMKTEEGKHVMVEAKKAVQDGALLPVEAKHLARKIAHAENQKKPVLTATTPVGVKKMEELNKATSAGHLHPEEAKQLAAKVVVNEEIKKKAEEAISEGMSAEIAKVEKRGKSKMGKLAEEIIGKKVRLSHVPKHATMDEFNAAQLPGYDHEENSNAPIDDEI